MGYGINRRARGFAVALAVLAGVSAAGAQTNRPAGGVSGKVTDKGSGAPIVGVAVQVEGSSAGVVTGSDGSYRIASVAPGAQTITTRRIGYVSAKKTVTVADNQTVTADFALEAAATSLQAVVMTATGAQRRIELGNAVSTIEASARIAETPVKNIGDLLSAQMPGVQVSTAGLTGGTSRIRIRGQSSLALANDPIYIIDGVRMTSTSSGNGTGGGTVPSRANDINPEEIESIEVVKGPSAATLYGTDAANGVIVITTKRGRAGKPVFAFHTEQGRLDDRNNYPATYSLLGHSPGATAQKRCFTYDIAEGSCLLDSATVLNLWKNPATTTIKYGSRRLVGGQVSGGSEQVRYFISADMNEETGPVGLPAVDKQRFDSLGVQIRPNMLRPNNLQQLSLRSNVDVAITPHLDVSVSAGLTSLDQRFPQSENGNVASYVQQMTFGPGYRTGPGYSGVGAAGEPLFGYAAMTPGEVFQFVSSQNVVRFVGSSTVNWRPMNWLQVRGDVGYDMANQDDYTLQRFGEGPTGGTNLLGSSGDTRTTHVNFTSNLGATGTWQLRPWAQLRSTVGTQYVVNSRNITSARGTQLVPGGELPSQGTIFSVTASSVPSKTLGMFIEEQLALRDRLYFTVAVRSDKNSAFGVNYAGVYYPKASVSWILSDESFFPHMKYLEQLRVRTSFGASGVQPGATAALRTYTSATVNFGNAAVAGLAVSNPGNPNLRPERTSEVEAGIDAKLFGGRANIELTYYKKNTNDALINQPVAPSAGVSGYLANLGGVQNSGVEYSLHAQLIDRRDLGWDVTYAGSYNANKVVSLGGIIAAPFASASVGYPVGSAYGRILTYADANNDGLLSRGEVTISTAANQVFLGPFNPPTQVSVSTGVELFSHRLRLSALADRRAGGRIANLELMLPCLVAIGCGDLQRMNAPLAVQARGIAVKQGVTSVYNQDMSFTRLREITASYTLDETLVRQLMRGSSARISLSVRNVALWKTSYDGTDPESSYGSSADLGSAAAQNVAATSPPMYLMLRLNITY